jgi:hypothetical protein
LNHGDGGSITYSAQQAYMDFGTSAIKQPQMLMPVMELSRSVGFETGIDTDFTTQTQTGTTTVSASGQARWGESLWGAARWGSANSIQRAWGGTASWPGRWLSGKVRLVSSEVSGKWIGNVMRFTTGDGL